MGAPKQRWSREEESAIRAGVVKHGTGRWSTILKDPEFASILRLRSNVDLKDKWRNLSMTANGWGSREKGRIAFKRSRHTPKHDDNPLALNKEAENSDENDIVDAKPLAVSVGPPQIAAPKKNVIKLDKLILEAIASLKEPNGSNKTAIAMYIEEQYYSSPDIRRLLPAKLNALTASNKLVKDNNRYRINSDFSQGRISKAIHLQRSQADFSRLDRDQFKPLMKPQVDADLAQMINMTLQEAAAAAAQAVAEAEVAMAEAEEAAKEAEAAEAEAEAAQAFAEAAMLMLKDRHAAKLMV